MSSATLNDLPEDVLMNILARFPVKSLLQFKCVCKPWYAVIKDPIFITKHVNQSALRNNGYLAITRRGGNFLGKCSISLISYENFHEVITITLPYKEDGVALFQIVGSCNGILCMNVSKLGNTNFLFNPATSELKELPKPDDLFDEFISLQFGDVDPYDLDELIGLGFGYDAKSNDYKLVRISYSKMVGGKVYSEVDVYSLSTNSWRRKDKLVHGTVVKNSFSEALINGALHWRGATTVVRNLIISFGLRDEMSHYIELPEINLDGNEIYEWFPFVRKELLAIVISSGEYQRTFNIWVMNEYGIKETWNKQLTVGPIYVHRLVGCGRNEELLFVSYSMMYVYDLQRNPPCDINEANDNRIGFVSRERGVVNHIESLVTIEGTKVCVERKRTKRSWFKEILNILICVLIGLFIIIGIYFRDPYFDEACRTYRHFKYPRGNPFVMGPDNYPVCKEYGYCMCPLFLSKERLPTSADQ